MVLGRKELLESAELFVIDMDGTFYCSNTIIDGAIDFIEVLRERGKRFIFFTNNTSKNPEDYIKKLEGMGCYITREQFMTAADVTLAYLKSYEADKQVYLIGTPELEQQFQQNGICLSEDADIVMVAFDTTITYEKLKIGCDLIRHGASFYATHPDINCPVTGGFIPDCGAICAAIELSTGKKPKIFGKPYSDTAQMIHEKTGISVEKMAFVGDRLYTDIASGVNNGGLGFLVLTGETKMEDLEESEIIPSAVFESLGEMGQIMRQNQN
ncbi:MAG: HAD-IIA family hydrolase [Eubacteriales bacterium]|nr:HAD-IIA family hydrolase [Eubacteriales bacterium]